MASELHFRPFVFDFGLNAIEKHNAEGITKRKIWMMKNKDMFFFYSLFEWVLRTWFIHNDDDLHFLASERMDLKKKGTAKQNKWK